MMNGHQICDEPDFVEVHHRQRTHVVFPQDVWDMALREELSMMHLELLNIIDSLVDRKGVGCWATNTWLGKQINRSPNHVSTMVKKLKTLGLLKCVGWIVLRDNKYRILETIWSRVVEKGKDRTPQAAEMELEFDKSNGKVQVHLFPPERKRGGSNEKSLDGGLTKNRKHIPDSYSHTTYENTHQKLSKDGPENPGPSSCVNGQPSRFLTNVANDNPPSVQINGHRQTVNGHVIKPIKLTAKQVKLIPNVCFELNDQFRAIMRLSIKERSVIPWSRKGGANQFRILLKSLKNNESYLQEQMDRYAALVDSIRRPTVSTPKGFRVCFNGIVDTMDAIEEKVLGVLEIRDESKVEKIPMGNGITNNCVVKKKVKVRVKRWKDDNGKWQVKETKVS